MKRIDGIIEGESIERKEKVLSKVRIDNGIFGELMKKNREIWMMVVGKNDVIENGGI